MKPCTLLFGMPRSGTTWVGKIFDSHPDTLYRHEPDSARRLSLPLYVENADAPRYRDELRQFVGKLSRMRSPEVVGKQPLFRKNYQSAAQLYAYRASVLVAKAASRVYRHAPCLYRPTARDGAHALVVWKSIESPGRLGVCMEALSQAKAVYLMRHPCGYVASVLRGQAAQRFENAADSRAEMVTLRMLLDTESGRKHGLRASDLAGLSAAERLAWRWVLVQEKIRDDVAGCDRVLRLKYEDICADPEAMTRRMFAFCGLDYPPQSRHFVRASTATERSDYYSVFKDPMTSANRWRVTLEPDVIERIMRVVNTSSMRGVYDERQRDDMAMVEAS